MRKGSDEMAKLCLGTVQFGMKYGINNQAGQPSECEVFEMLDCAVEQGINVYDTAMAYGTAEELIGKYIESRHVDKKNFKLISKLCPNSIEDLKNTESTVNTVYSEICGSIERLHADHLYGYLLHTPEYIYNESILRALEKIKADGLTSNVGVSIYNISDGEAALESGIVDFIQLPYSVLDQRGLHSRFLQKAKEKGVTTFTRSAFLQGLFMMDFDKIPEYLGNAKKYLQDFENILDEFQLDRVEALLNFPAGNSDIDYVVIGVDNKMQLQEDINKFGTELPSGFLKRVCRLFEHVEEGIILPSLWADGKKVK